MSTKIWSLITDLNFKPQILRRALALLLGSGSSAFSGLVSNFKLMILNS